MSLFWFSKSPQSFLNLCRHEALFAATGILLALCVVHSFLSLVSKRSFHICPPSSKHSLYRPVCSCPMPEPREQVSSIQFLSCQKTNNSSALLTTRPNSNPPTALFAQPNTLVCWLPLQAMMTIHALRRSLALMVHAAPRRRATATMVLRPVAPLANLPTTCAGAIVMPRPSAGDMQTQRTRSVL